MAAFDAQNINIGPCKVLLNNTNLGFTKGGVEVTVESETHEVVVDQHGSTPVDELIIGRMVTVTVPLAETTLDTLVATMPGATLIGNATKKVEIPTGVGLSLLDSAEELVLRPQAKTVELGSASGSDEEDRDFTVPRAATAGNMTFAYKLDEERIYNVTFKGYPDANNIIAILGDTAASD